MNPYVIEETPDWLALAKPSGWHSLHRPQNPQALSVEVWLKSRFTSQANLPEAGLVHRLDKPTSGLILAAKSLKSYEQLRARFQNPLNENRLRKFYLALITKKPPLPFGDFEFFFSSRYRGSKKMSVTTKGKASERGVCRWRVFKTISNSKVLLEVELVGPGKRHQIRAGLAEMGMPLSGDPLYGGEGSEFLLHSFRIEIDGRKIELPLGG